MITVLGLGYIGLTTALGLCSKGYKVRGYDIDKNKEACLNAGTLPFFEPTLDQVLLQEKDKRFFIVKSMEEAIAESSCIFFCVGVENNEDGTLDSTPLLNAIESVVNSSRKGDYKLYVLRSTIPPSTTKDVVLPFIESLGLKIGTDVGLAYNPEFLREGSAWDDFINPDRIVLGCADKISGDKLENIYKVFNSPIHKVSLNTAEFIKYLSNTMLSTFISFSNEMSMVADAIGGIDVPKSFKILTQDKRWFGEPAAMTSYVFPGCGFGGYCLPKDTEALHSKSEERGFRPALIEEVLKTNTKIKDFVVNKIVEVSQTKDYIGILGLSFKPGTDDIRNTPSLHIIRGLLEKGFSKIIAYDPLANEQFKACYSLPIEYASSIEEVVGKAQHIAVLTSWKEFVERKELIFTKNVLDFRYTFAKEI